VEPAVERCTPDLAIEPLLVLGSPETRLLDDGWTVVSEDGGWSAHFEHTVAITSAGPWVLTASAGPPAGTVAAGQVIAGDLRPSGNRTRPAEEVGLDGQ